MHVIPTIRVVCAVIIRHGKALAVRRSKDMKMPLLWEFPGGKVHDGESDERALEREIKEELHSEIRIIRPLKPVHHQYKHFIIDLIPFLCELRSDRIVLHEHAELWWCSRRELGLLEWCEADVPIAGEVAGLIGHD